MRPSKATQADVELSALEHLYRTAPVGLCLMDREFRYLRVNERLAEFHNRPASDHIGRTLHEVVPNIALEVEGVLREVFESGQPILDRELEGATPADSETIRFWLGSYYPIKNGDGKVELVSVVVQEITQQKEVERELRESKRRYDLATAGGSVGVWDWNLETGEIFVDPVLKALLGFEEHEIRNDIDDWLPRMHPEDLKGVRAKVDAHLKGRTAHFESEHRMVCKDGGVRWILARGTALRDANGKAHRFLGTDIDITEKRGLQEELLTIADREQRRIGQELHDTIGQELVGLSYLTRNLTDTHRDETSPQLTTAAKIAAGLERALAQVRTLSRGLIPAELEPQDLATALEELVSRSNEMGEPTCSFECVDGVGVLDQRAATHLYRIAQESLTNALKHGWARHISVSLARRGGFVRLRILDDGVGIPETELKKGLGQQIMAFRAELIGAELEVEKVPRGGTLVSCSLPI